ncbi:MAG: putative toxin-antitoxin system toxin component, PIN family [Candidatus Gottesmanbacteria bacterium]|nr:putative toxin-antitoxin system toxin component, PIN family [Candidatus Gottesmanbacteria bacterium]
MSLSEPPRVVIDTNVFVSGILYGGNAQRVLHLFQLDRIIVVISPPTLAEILLTLQKFDVPEATLDELSDLMQAKARKVSPKEHIRASRDPKDNMMLEAAVAGKANYLVTGDKDLLTLGSHGRTLIVTPKVFLDRMSL